MTDTSIPPHSFPVYPGGAFRVSVGANAGDGISVMEDLEQDDYYELDAQARTSRLSLHLQPHGHYVIGADSEIGKPGAIVHLDCALLLMNPKADSQDALVLVEVDDAGMIAQIYLLPLAPLEPKTEYSLVGISRESAKAKFAQAGCVSFSRGTRITMASGEQRPIEQLTIGDRVLTRDGGAQEVRWIGQTTVRATGAFAPILIRSGTLNNANDLVVSPEHRLFIYQRTDRIGAGRSEILVKARHLVNGDSVIVQHGGFVDYFQILFDNHQLIYAEGIAAESLLVDPRTQPALPIELQKEVAQLLRSHNSPQHHGLDVKSKLLDRPDALELLRAASLR